MPWMQNGRFFKVILFVPDYCPKYSRLHWVFKTQSEKKIKKNKTWNGFISCKYSPISLMGKNVFINVSYD